MAKYHHWACLQATHCVATQSSLSSLFQAVVAGLIKVCLAYEHGILPGNLHFNEPNPNSESLKSGILKVPHPAPTTSHLKCSLSDSGLLHTVPQRVSWQESR